MSVCWDALLCRSASSSAASAWCGVTSLWSALLPPSIAFTSLVGSTNSWGLSSHGCPPRRVCCATHSYDLELLDFEAADEGKERAMMTFEERLEAAERRRADGNTAFSAGQYAEALGKYRCVADQGDRVVDAGQPSRGCAPSAGGRAMVYR